VSAPAPAWRSTAAQAGMELRLTARRGENILVTIVIPAIILAFFGAVPLETGTGSGVSDLLPGVLALAIIATGLVNLGIATAYERAYGVLKRLGASPLPRAGLLAAKGISVVGIEIVQVALLVGIAVLAFGWQPAAGWSPLVVLLGMAVGTAAFVALGLALAGTLRPEATLAVANGLFLLFLLLGGIVVPLDRLPDAVAAIAAILPAAALADVLRIGLGATSGDPVGPFLVLVAWATGAAVVAGRTFRWE